MHCIRFRNTALLLTAVILLCTACSSRSDSAPVKEGSSASLTDDNEISVSQADDISAPESDGSAVTDSGSAPESDGSATDSRPVQNTDISKMSANASELLSYDIDPSTPIVIDNPDWEYYLAEETPVRGHTLKLKMTSSTDVIFSADRWLRTYDFTQPEIPYSDQTYTYKYNSYNDYYVYTIRICDAVTDELLRTFDFSNYSFADEYNEADVDFIQQRVCWFQAKNNVLYVGIGHNTYSESCMHTGYIVAVDMTDGHVLWKTQPRVFNSRNFQIVDDYLICAYGFTLEEDHLNVIDLSNGELTQQVYLRSAADYIMRKDNDLYIRCYDTDYIFHMSLDE